MVGDTNTSMFFITHQQYVYFQYHPQIGQSKIFLTFFKIFTLLGLPLKKLNFTMYVFPQVYHLKMVFAQNFLKLAVTVCFQNNECFKNVNFLPFF